MEDGSSPAALVTMCLALPVAGTAVAQSFPSKPVRLVVPFAATMNAGQFNGFLRAETRSNEEIVRDANIRM